MTGRCDFCGAELGMVRYHVTVSGKRGDYCSAACATSATVKPRCCEDCKHWSKGPAYQDEWGTCSVLTHSASPYIQNRANLALKEPQPFNTNKGFGCVEFQSREGDE
jgi:hypothetical protein